ncbi:MAG TPA: prolyl oligopeptidase family serine peptidase [Thermoanaerobaculia bacterium]|nr:prolyl oligopeptidase family serine peptidase [Thermoanaerobaculia bacterium]
MMSKRHLAMAFLAAGALALPGSPGWAADAPADNLSVPDSIIARNVPPIPKSLTEDLRPYENLRGASFSSWHPTERWMLIGTRFAESNQIHEVRMPMGARTQLTFYRDPVFGGYRPNNGDAIVFAINEGGAENFQMFYLDRKTGRPKRFTDGKSRNLGGAFSHDGKLMAFVNNARNGRELDVYVGDPANPESIRMVTDGGQNWGVADWHPDGKRLLISQFVNINESYLRELDLATGQTRLITQKSKDGTPIAYRGGRWSMDGKSIITVTDHGSEFARLVRMDPQTGAITPLSANIDWDVNGFDLSEDGKLVAFMTNEDGFGKLHILDLQTGKELPSPELPPGVAGGLEFRKGTHELGFSVSWARSPSDVYSYDVATRKLERWTASEAGGLNTAEFVVPELVRYPTFDKDERTGQQRTIPAFVYRAPANRHPGKRPVYIDFHGGPEAQEQPGFKGSLNYFINELGITVIMPNVRGSSGYGRTYLLLDNGKKREDSVKDAGALLDWIAKQPDLDASRVVVAGGSYGGYMTLAALTHYSDRLRGGYSTVGISNWVTFLQNTSPYRQDNRRSEYGDERDPEMRAFLEKISPLTNVDRIKVPMMVAQGANDPRVPLSESDQIVKAVEAKGLPVWYLVGKDEGHGFSKKSNSDFARAVQVEFLRKYLLPEQAPAVTAK